MKIRQGFVSNSSTTSFCIYGADFINDKAELVDGIFEEKKLPREWKNVGDPNYNFRLCIGLPLSAMDDDETKKQFQNRIETQLKEWFPDMELEFKMCEDSYYNG